MKKQFLQKKVSEEKETTYPIGLLQDSKKIAAVLRDDTAPKGFFTLSKKGKENIFSKNRTPLTIKNKLLKGSLQSKDIDTISAAHVGKKDILTFVYGKKDHQKKGFWARRLTEHEWRVAGSLPTGESPVGIVSDYVHNKKHVAYYGEIAIHIAFSSDLKRWTKAKEPAMRARPGFFDHGRLKFIATHQSARGILVFYDASERHGDDILLQIGVGLFSLTNPEKLIWRSDTPVFQEKVRYGHDIECKGTVFLDGIVSFYWYSKDRGFITASIVEPFSKHMGPGKVRKLDRHAENPIVAPQEKWWSSEATLNPAAVHLEDAVHLLFRAMGSDGVSRIGYAKSEDGLHIDEISDEPVFSLRYPYIGKKTPEKKYDPVMYPSGGSWGGCEDPRIVVIGDRLYMTFNSFDGWDNMRVGLTSIELADFLNKEWNWEKPQLISPGRAKNWILFPEKVNGKFALLHSIHGDSPDRIRIEYLDSLDNIDTKLMKFESPDPQRVPFRPIAWHVHMRSATTPPIKTPDGWLVLYHAHHADDLQRYKLGAMLLDLNDPTKVLARSSVPILVPDMWYENEGKPGIVYANGAVVKDDTLFIYYGGGDKHVCVATAPLHDFIESLKTNASKIPVLTQVIIE